jgi:holin-like protein
MQTALQAITADGAAGSTQRRQSETTWLKGIAAIPLQLLGLWALNAAGVWVVEKTALPIPGNLVGMVVLYGLLALGVVKLSWFEASGSFLIRHLAFFFVPITVGLMNTGALFATHGIGIVVVLAVSAAIGVMLAGWISQLLFRKPGQAGGEL